MLTLNHPVGTGIAPMVEAMNFQFNVTKTASPGAEPQALGQFIPLHYHYNMLQDRSRVEAFQQSISQIVLPGAKVLELGGGTGILSYFAARQASKVWCVEWNVELANAAQRFLSAHPEGERVEVCCADANDFLPPEPVDVVICEMLHAGLLREAQISVIESFKKRYAERFGNHTVRFIPDVSILGFQPIEQSFCFAGYHAPVPLFQRPSEVHTDSKVLAPPTVYQTHWYEQDHPGTISWRGQVIVTESGALNAIRLLTNNVLGVIEKPQQVFEWANQNLVLPIADPLQVVAEDVIEIAFSYPTGGSINQVIDSLSVTPVDAQQAVPKAA